MKVIVEFVQCQLTEVEVITIQFQLEKRIQHTFKAMEPCHMNGRKRSKMTFNYLVIIKICKEYILKVFLNEFLQMSS